LFLPSQVHLSHASGSFHIEGPKFSYPGKDDAYVRETRRDYRHGRWTAGGDVGW